MNMDRINIDAARSDRSVKGSVMRMATSFTQARRPGRSCRLIRSILLIAGSLGAACAHGAPNTSRHYAPNHNIDAEGKYLPGKVGFNLADVDDVGQLDALPNGVKALVWIGQCNGGDETFRKAVMPFLGKPKVFGFYLMDDPDPTGWYKSRCTPDNLKAESNWIHSHGAGIKTFIVLMKLSSSTAPSFIDTYNPANSHIDLFGIDPYPCRTELSGCDYEMIDRYVAAAAAWGIPQSAIVPVYQAFGGGNWRDDGGGKYILPSANQIQQMLDRWATLVPAPVFDYAYSWGSQRGDDALESAPQLHAVFARHNKLPRP
jgi:hypothetical protein